MKMRFFAITVTGADMIDFDSSELGGPNASFEEMRKKAEKLYNERSGSTALMFDTYENLIKKM